MTSEQIDERKAYVQKARASFDNREADWTQPLPKEDRPALVSPMLAISVLSGFFLFLLFVYCDVSQTKILDYSTDEIVTQFIQKDDYTNLEKYVMMLLANNN
ncbi:MAG: hypothetical protein PUD20_01825 [bacterium]|nr:hypothetical protein [bacterium]